MKCKPYMDVMQCLFLMMVLATAAASAQADTWTIEPENSEIVFSGTQTGNPFEGRFNAFDADIRFDPSAPENAYVRAVIKTGSAITGDKQRDEAMRSKDWFAVSMFPDIVFEASGFKKTAETSYTAFGILRVLGVEHPFTLPFDLTTNGQTAIMTSHINLDRRDIGVGTGAWSEGKWVGLDVAVDVRIVAKEETP